MSKKIKKPTSSSTVPCKFRGTGIECPTSDFSSMRCENCGWNPDVEEKRIERLKDGRD